MRFLLGTSLLLSFTACIGDESDDTIGDEPVAEATSNLVTSYTGKFRGFQSGRCIRDANHRLVLDDCTVATPFVRTDAGGMRREGSASTCIDMAYGQPGYQLQTYDQCHGNLQSQGVHLGYGQIKNLAWGKCIGVSGNAIYAQGAVVESQNCSATNSNPAQNWYFVPGTREIKNHGGQCLDLPNGTTTNGNQLRLWPCNGTPSQQWSIGRYGIKSFRGSNTNPETTGGKCVDFDGSRAGAAGSRVAIWDCYAKPASANDNRASDAQYLTFEGTVWIGTESSRGFVDAANASIAPGTPIIGNPSYYGNINQLWVFEP